MAEEGTQAGDMAAGMPPGIMVVEVIIRHGGINLDLEQAP
ncbi:hypothetical protein BSG1_12991 [Bacillus sp. SG-1]|nr:hypothetical protein BSG1_12991 [Bacillus sp. SG-1]